MKFLPIITNYKHFLTFLFLLTCTWAHAQNRAALQQQKTVIDQWIKATSKMLAETEKNKSATIDKYNLIENQIENRKSLLEIVNAQIAYSQEQLEENEEIISLLKIDISDLKEDYATMLRYAYRKKLMQNEWLYILSSASVKEAVLKMRYTEQYNEFKTQKAELIQRRILEMEEKSVLLDSLIKDQEKLLATEKEASTKLQSELYEKDVVLHTLALSSARMRSELAQQEKEKRRLDNIIDEIISTTISKTATTANAGKTSSAKANNTMSIDFETNRGKLPWPVEQGFVSSRFGIQKHPTLQNVSIQNNGIDIRAEAGTNVKSIFAGKVTHTMSTAGYGNMVIIKQGDYLIVYARLAEMYIKEGDDVVADQTIGKLGVVNNKAELQLQIWKNSEKLDPQKWISRSLR